MLGTPLMIVLQLPPLAFSPALPPPYQMPRELVCDVHDIGKPLETKKLTTPNLPRFATSKPSKTYLFGPKTDHLIYVLGILAAGATGGTLDTRTPEQKIQDRSFAAPNH